MLFSAFLPVLASSQLHEMVNRSCQLQLIRKQLRNHQQAALLAAVKLCSYWYCVQAASYTAEENPQKRGFILAAERLISLSLLGLETLL
jgi:hypothetical protein